jgi:hypothetical protein
MSLYIMSTSKSFSGRVVGGVGGGVSRNEFLNAVSLLADDIDGILGVGEAGGIVIKNESNTLATSNVFGYDGMTVRINKPDVTTGYLDNISLDISGGTVIKGDVWINGNFNVTGTTTTVETVNLVVENNKITLNDGMSGLPNLNLDSGFIINRGTEEDYHIFYKEQYKNIYVGVSGELLYPLSERNEEIRNNAVMIWTERSARNGYMRGEDMFWDNGLKMGNKIDMSGNAIVDISGMRFRNGSYVYEIGSNMELWGTNQIISRKRIQQQLNSSTSIYSINGYYGLAKNIRPALNPMIGEKAVSNWTSRSAPTHNYNCIAWSPELRIFVTLSSVTSVGAWSNDGINWTSMVVNGGWNSVCWSPDLRMFVAVGTSASTSHSAYSLDGKTWVSTTPISGKTWNSVCWSPDLGMFIAVASSGTGNRIMRSSNGIVWDTVTSPADNNWTSVCWSPELGIFVAVASTGNQTMSSTNGTSWTLSSSISSIWQSICWSPKLNMFIAVGASGGVNIIMRSSNGTSWTSLTSPENNWWNSVCWAEEIGVFVAVSLSGSVNRIMYSSNGTSWTSIISPSPDNDFRSICWAPELGIFCAVCRFMVGNRIVTSSLSGRIPTSINVFDSSFNNIDENGNWTLRAKSIIGDGLTMNCVAISDVSNISFCNNSTIGRGEIVDASGNYLLTINGVGDRLITNDQIYQNHKWKSLTGHVALTKQINPPRELTKYLIHELPSSTWFGVCWSPELRIFVTVSLSTGESNKIMISRDGINWIGNIYNSANEWTSVTWSSDRKLFVAVSVTLSSNTKIITSPDGIIWSTAETDKPINNISNNTQIANIIWCPELQIFVGVSANGTLNNRVVVSSDGITWTGYDPPQYSQWSGLVWSKELSIFVATSRSGTRRIMTSYNGINWTLRDAPSVEAWRSVCWSGELGIFVAVSSSVNGSVMTSTNGVNWELRTTPPNGGIRYVTWAPELGIFVAVTITENEPILYSLDGITWDKITITGIHSLNDVCWAPEIGIICGVGINSSITSSLSERTVTTYNVFDSSFNNIDNSGNWTIKSKEIYGDDLSLNANVSIQGHSIRFEAFNSAIVPSIDNNPVSLTRISILNNEVGYSLPLGFTEITYGDIVKNQLNLGIDGSIISPSLDIQGQYVELYANVKVNAPNNTHFSLDISGVECAFYHIIDDRTVAKSGMYYLTFGPHMFIPNEWEDCPQFMFKFNNHGTGTISVIEAKLIFKSYYL